MGTVLGLPGKAEEILRSRRITNKMSSKSGKQKGRDSLPRSASTMSDESNEASISASKSSSSSSVAASSVKASSSSYALEMTNGDLSLPGFLSLKELNNLLEKYISEVQGLDLSMTKSTGNTSVTVNIDRSEILNIQSQYDDQLADWKKKCDDKDKEIAALKAEIARLKAEIKILTESGKNKDGIIKERDLTIETLKSEISRLTAILSMVKNQKEIYEVQIKHLQDEVAKLRSELNNLVNALASEQNHSQDLCWKLGSLEADLRFKIDVLGSELASERGKTNIDIASLDTRIQGQYADRLKDELEILRKIYKEHMRVSQESLEMSYKKKVADLEVYLKAQIDSAKPTEDMTAIKIEIEKYKKKIEELDTNTRDLSLQWSRLQVELKEKEASFQAKMLAKETEMNYMAKQTAEYKKMCDEMRGKLLSEATEVQVYNRLITPEMNRITNIYSDQFANGTEESMKSIRVTQSMSKSASSMGGSASLSGSASISGSASMKRNSSSVSK